MVRWLASYPKSGNTWVRCFLEAYLTGRLDINDMLTSTSDVWGHWYREHLPTMEPHRFNDTELMMIRPAALLGMVRDLDHCDFTVVKTHFPFMELRGIHAFPAPVRGKAVYLTREFDDVAASLSRHAGIDGAKWMRKPHVVWAGGSAAPDTVKVLSVDWATHIESWRDHPDCLFVAYEDLKADPGVWFEKILAQYGIEYNTERMGFALEATTLENLMRLEDENGFVEAGFGRFFGG